MVVGFALSARMTYANFEVERLQEIGVIDEGEFDSGRLVSRAEMVKMLEAPINLEGELDMYCFDDVRSEWFAPYICQAAGDDGYLEGYADGSFQPDRNVNFVEAAKMISVKYGLQSEMGADGPWYRVNVEALSGVGAVPQTINSFGQKVTRGEVAEMIYHAKKGAEGEIDANRYKRNFWEIEMAANAVTADFSQYGQPRIGEKVVVIETNMGEMRFRMFPHFAPKSVENLVTHAREDYYDELVFHRVIDEFVIQGGDPEGLGTGGESIWGGMNFEDEITEKLEFVKGTLGMANSGPNTNGSQFFVVHADTTSWLNGHHTIFGQMYDGEDVLDAIAGVAVDERDKPFEDVVIIDIRLEIFSK